MRFLGVLTIASGLAFAPLIAKEEASDLARWEVAYSGDLVLAHKLYLARGADTVEEEIHNMFYLFYASMKAEQFDKALEILDGIDVIVKGKIIDSSEEDKTPTHHEAPEEWNILDPLLICNESDS